MKKVTSAALILAGMSGCTAGAVSTGSSQAVSIPAEAETRLDCGSSAAKGESAESSADSTTGALICAGTRPWAIGVDKTGFAAFEGARVWLSGVETPEDEAPFDESTGTLSVFLSGAVADGRIKLGCDGAIDENHNYPMAAIIIDADGNGRCSEEDLVHEDLFYAWGLSWEDRSGDLSIDLSALDMGEEHSRWSTIATANTRSWHNLCETYFPE